MAKTNSKQDHFDSSWKDILDAFLHWFLLLFFPKIYEDIDWSKGYESLEKELQKIANEAVVGKRYVDKLLKVYRKNGKEAWVYIHIDVQSQRRRRIPERMYIYNSLLYLRFNKPIMSLLVLGDDQPNWRPDRFEYDLWESHLSLKFPSVKLLDYRDQEEELKQSKNPFAYFVIAHLKTM